MNGSHFNGQNGRAEKLSKGIAMILNNAIKMLAASGKIGKVGAFADLVDMSENVLYKKLNGLTPLGLEEFWMFAAKIKELDEATTYRWLVRQVFMDMEL